MRPGSEAVRSQLLPLICNITAIHFISFHPSPLPPPLPLHTGVWVPAGGGGHGRVRKTAWWKTRYLGSNECGVTHVHRHTMPTLLGKIFHNKVVVIGALCFFGSSKQRTFLLLFWKKMLLDLSTILHSPLTILRRLHLLAKTVWHSWKLQNK